MSYIVREGPFRYVFNQITGMEVPYIHNVSLQTSDMHLSIFFPQLLLYPTKSFWYIELCFTTERQI